MKLRVKNSHSAMALAAIPVGVCLVLSAAITPVASADPAPLAARQWEAWPGVSVSPRVVVAEKGLVETSEEMAEVAPDAFAMDGNRIVLHDPLHDTVRTYVGGTLARKTAMPFVAVEDLVVSGDALTVLGDANTLRTYRIGAGKAQALATARLKTSEKLTTLRTSGGVLSAWTEDGRSVAVNAERTGFVGTLGAAEPDRVVMNSDGYTVTGVSGGITRIRLAHTPVGIDELAMADGSAWYQVADWYSTEDRGWIIERFVFQVAASGEVLHRYTLDPSPTSVPARMVQVFNGGVYQLAIDGHTTRVLRLNPDASAAAPVFSDAVVKSRGRSTRTAGVPAQVTKKKPKPPARYKIRVFQRAQALADYTWKYTAKDNGNKKVITGRIGKKAISALVVQPHYLKDVSRKTVVGYPYTWGGFDADLSSSSPRRWKNFEAGLNKGFYTGNVSKASGGYAPGTIGLDCSGYISAVFGIKKKHSTGNLLDGTYFAKSNAKPIPGDIFLHPGHVMLVTSTYYDSHGKLWIGVLEATTDGGADRVVSNKHQVGKLDTDYRTGRYRNWNYKCAPGIPCAVSVDR